MSWRSLLFAPGTRPDLMAKLPRTDPDAVILDLEDAVPLEAKASARELIRSAAGDLIATNPELAVFVRINPVPSRFFNDDVSGLPEGIRGIVVPKVETAGELHRVSDALDRRDLLGREIIAGIETVAGVVAVADLLGQPGVAACYFGAEDYVADLGGVRTRDGFEVLYARSRVAMAARLAGVPAIDQAVIELRDEDVYRSDAAVGRSLGYRGKLCIHPSQVSWANEAFSATAEEIDRAERLLEAYEAARRDGQASIDFEGQMVDEPIARQARALLGR